MGMLVHFFELSGPEAREKLDFFREEISQLQDITSLELLENLEQPGLFLLIIKSPSKLDLEPPRGTRVWMFQNL
jgi:hypothetical protein